MRRFLNLILPILLVAIANFAASPAGAATGGVQDGGSFFSKEAIGNADDLIRDILTIDNRGVLVVTYAAIPDDRQDEFKTKGKQRFFSDWVEDIRRQNGISGIVILLTREPSHLQITVGNKTAEHSFTLEDRDQLTAKMLPLLKDKQYDDALLDGLRFVREKMKRANMPAAAQNSQVTPPYGNSSPYSNAPTHIPNSGYPVSGLLCVGAVILVIVFFIIKMAGGNRGYGGGYGASPSGGYPPNYSGGYPQGGGYGGGGGGFGKGLLGGLLGGALGAWGYERFNQPGNTGYTPLPPAGGGNFDPSSDQTDTSSSSTGGDFDSSSSSDSSSSGGDFGSSSDSSSSSDFGGGGDSGGSSGGDF